MMSEEKPVIKNTIYTRVVKRMLDIIISLLLIIVLSPIFILVSILELCIHGRPIIFAQERIGFHGKKFYIYKFRSMSNATDDKGNLLPGNERTTEFGKILRKLSIDEIPSLFCILNGTMSFIGPRPLLAKYLPLYSERHLLRHELRPGLACLPLHPIKTWSWNDQFENDIWYIEHCSFIVDLQMCFAIIHEALVGSDYRTNDTRKEFTGNNLFDDARKKE